MKFEIPVIDRGDIKTLLEQNYNDWNLLTMAHCGN